MARRNSVNNHFTELTIDPGPTADSYAQFSLIGSDKYKLGSDYSDSGKFKISLGSALGTSDSFIVHTNYENTQPLTPAYGGVISSLTSNVTGGGAVWVATGFTEIFDQNSDFGTSIFTAPVTGKYRLSGETVLSGFTSSITYLQLSIWTTTRHYASFITNPYVLKSSSGQLGVHLSVFAAMTAADEAKFRVYGYGGTNVVDVVAGGTFFNGHLAC